MTKEQIILILVDSITLAALLLLIPKRRAREATTVYTFKQSITWVLGLLIVEYHLIEYPVREFAVANSTSFSFEFFIYPAICVIYNLRFPIKRKRWVRAGWILGFPTGMTLVEVVIEKYTELIEYTHWTWYWSWITLTATFFLSRSFYLWFYGKRGAEGSSSTQGAEE
ncbi:MULTISPECIES: CBO0543 family protein [Paenibacillus]|uniref:CBO0543 family protein n=1 Tax=Paenibacillus TaxID=44249 RepID=UPI0022B8C096|nr:CBO0543 family protein [Paenibacillus caseinilyticus]MCZ8518597.1 hypothetical protein [Paenibacillus caseinilyticus]